MGETVLLESDAEGSGKSETGANSTLFRKGMIKRDFRSAEGVEMAHGAVSVLR